MNETFEPFSGLRQQCRVCGSTGYPLDRFHGGRCLRGQDTYLDVTSTGDRLVPHLHRTCPNCGFEWLETTLHDGDLSPLGLKS